MKKLLPILILFLLLINQNKAYSQTNTIESGLKTTVSGTVGEFYLNFSGYIAPFASVVLTSDGVLLATTTADENGYFYLTDILIKAGSSKFCFEATDLRQLGKSYSCMSIPPAEDSATIEGIFLPPTLGLLRLEIAEGSSTIAHGYSMPDALVTLHVGENMYLTKADESGYYEFTLENLKGGTYQVYATAKFKGTDSLEPQKKFTLKVLSWWEQFLQFLRELWEKFVNLLTSISLGPLWIAIPVLILIIILLKKLWPAAFTSIFHGKFFIFFPHLLRKSKKHLHHDWWMGY